MSMDGGSLGVAYVEIRPDVSRFEATVNSSIGNVSRGGGATIPLGADTTQFEAQALAAGDRVKSALTKTLGLIGIGVGAGALLDTVKGASDLNRQIDQTNRLFGDSASKVLAFSDTSVNALAMSKAQALDTANSYGRMFNSFGIAKDQLATDATQITNIVAKVADAAVVDPQSVADAFETAFRTGTDRSLKILRGFGINVTNKSLQDTAEQLGLITSQGPDAKAIQQAKTYGDQIAILQDRLTPKSNAPNPRKTAEDTLALNIAQARYNDAVAKYGANTLQAAQARLALAHAQDSLNTADKNTPLPPDQRALIEDQITNLKQKQADLLKDSLPDLTEAQRTEALIYIAQQNAANLPPPQDPFAKMHAAITNAEDALGKGLLPSINRFSDWLSQHGPDVENFGAELGRGFGAAADAVSAVVSFIDRHQEAVKVFAGTIAGIFALHEVDKWGGRVISTIASIGDKAAGLEGKLFPNLNKLLEKLRILTPTSGTSPTGVLGSTIDNMTVVTMHVDTMIGGSGPLSKDNTTNLGPTGTAAASGAEGGAVGAEALGAQAAGAGLDLGVAGGTGAVGLEFGALMGLDAVLGHFYKRPWETYNDPNIRGILQATSGEAKGNTLQGYIDVYNQGQGGPLAKLFAEHDVEGIRELETFAQGRGWSGIADDLHTFELEMQTGLSGMFLNIEEAMLSAERYGQVHARLMTNLNTGEAAGVGSLFDPGSGGVGIRHAAGGSDWLTQPELMLVGEGTERERVMTESQINALRGSGGGTVYNITVNQPATEVDVITAVLRARDLDRMTNTRRLAAPPAWSPPLTLRAS